MSKFALFLAVTLEKEQLSSESRAGLGEGGAALDSHTDLEFQLKSQMPVLVKRGSRGPATERPALGHTENQ